MAEITEVKSALHELALPDADELLVKADLLRFVAGEIRKRGLTQKDTAELLDLDQPTVSALVNEKLGRFSVQKLMSLVARLGFAVSIHVQGDGTAFDVPLRRAA